MITVNELFAGIGAFRKALINQNIPHKIVGISEIDKFAIKSYEAMYGETRNYGDISKVEKLDYADLWTYGFPCQDISNAGRQAGIIKGETRSGLLYEVQKLLEKAKQDGELPKYLIMENVKPLVGKKFLPKFNEWLDCLFDIGYDTYWKVLNAADYGIPQKRERVFAISIRKDLKRGFAFPKPIPLTVKLLDLLEENVDERYYISNTSVEYFNKHNVECKSKNLGFRFEPIERERELTSAKRSRQTHSGLNQTTLLISEQGKHIERGSNTAVTLLARDYKGVGNQAMNGVLVYELQKDSNPKRQL